ncbi:MAG TPA: cohesin domain-containing protein [Candidatus Paceibacterota bacterium]|jgi:hypothetical protein|nr:cohesin domain-containing protein [Candidatus Paceibacterota bacterium]
MRHKIYLKFLCLLIFCLFVAPVANAQSSNIFFSTPKKQVREGDRLTVDVKVQSASQPINAISGIVTFPAGLVDVVSISKDGSIMNFWTREPKASRGQIVFEGIVLNPGFQGSNGIIFHINFEAKKAGTAFLGFAEGAILANDGLGTNVLAKLGSASFNIISRLIASGTETAEHGKVGSKLSALPVITEYSSLIESKDGFYLKGKGEPSALTKIVFKDIAAKSLGEQFINFLQSKKNKLDEVLVNNDPSGSFQYVSGKNLIAGAYNATPFLVDESTNTEKPGFGVQLLVSDSRIVKMLVVAINVLGLLIPIVALIVIIYFIPWYSFKRMRVIKKRLGLEEEKLDLSEHQLERQDKMQDKIDAI